MSVVVSQPQLRFRNVKSEQHVPLIVQHGADGEQARVLRQGRAFYRDIIQYQLDVSESSDALVPEASSTQSHSTQSLDLDDASFVRSELSMRQPAPRTSRQDVIR